MDTDKRYKQTSPAMFQEIDADGELKDKKYTRYYNSFSFRLENLDLTSFFGVHDRPMPLPLQEPVLSKPETLIRPVDETEVRIRSTAYEIETEKEDRSLSMMVTDPFFDDIVTIEPINNSFSVRIRGSKPNTDIKEGILGGFPCKVEIAPGGSHLDIFVSYDQLQLLSQSIKSDPTISITLVVCILSFTDQEVNFAPWSSIAFQEEAPAYVERFYMDTKSGKHAQSLEKLENSFDRFTYESKRLRRYNFYLLLALFPLMFFIIYVLMTD